MNYEEAVRYIADIPKFTKKHPLDHTREFVKRLGDPCRGKRAVHVAGTNGKGSVCAYVQAILLCEGKKTGLFTSPHLETVRERIVCNGEMISRREFLEVFLPVKETACRMEKEGLGHPSYFEFLYGMALAAFEKKGVEYLILETGLGGRLDATRAFGTPSVCTITSIGMDHTEILGDTLEKIAAEKAGIIRPKVPVVFLSEPREAAAVIRRTAEEAGAPCRGISKDAVKIQETGREHIAFLTGSEYDNNTSWQVRGSGAYQAVNATLALETSRILLGMERFSDCWREALAAAYWPGRMEEVLPDVVLDGAHNLAAVEEFVRSVKNWLAQEEARLHRKKELVILFSAVAEKDYQDMAALLGKEIPAKAFIITRIRDARGADTDSLEEAFRQATDSTVLVRDSLEEALDTARKEKGRDGRLYCLGSLYLTGELKLLLKQEKETGGSYA